MNTGTCATCGQQFDFEPVKYDGRIVFQPMHCPACSEDRECERKANERFRREAAHTAKLTATWEKICPPLYRDTNPSRLPQMPLARVLNWKFGSRGLILHGVTGTGKTRAAFLLLNRLHFQEKRKIKAFHGNTFAHECARRFGDQTGEAWIDNLARADAVFFDDLGKDKLTERVEAELFGLIETRTANLLPVILTTNLIGQSLEARLTEDRGAPLVRRLREFCESVTFQ